MSQTLINAFSGFKYLRLNLRFRLLQSGALPELKGSLFHGLLGNGLIRVDRNLYHALFVQHDNRAPKPYSLVCSDERAQLHQGQILALELRLFGHTVERAQSLVESLQYAASQLGIGPQRLLAELISVSSIVDAQEHVGIQSVDLLRGWQSTESSYPECALSLVSPLRIKHRGELLRHAPCADIVINAIARRFLSLCQYWYQDDPHLRELVYANIPNTHHITTIDHTYWQEWQRYGKRGGNQCQFGGLQGMISYQGAVADIQPWLSLGQTLQVGAKTTFGLGHYHLIRSEALC
ncbi:CRISPR system precrRNA processing endoribonuclease RAMP protein Cas6 [Vibrio chaetopteri]|uniref:CRISPR system precrRNA processing endoribonuclease RAMP protein Cas6 n=1 Tax=Vibrio chaetopteri TaxID=3016528 RepID=UPI003AB71DD4